MPRVPKGSPGGITRDFRMPSDNLEKGVDLSLWTIKSWRGCRKSLLAWR